MISGTIWLVWAWYNKREARLDNEILASELAEVGAIKGVEGTLEK